VSRKPKPRTDFDHPGVACPCAECAGTRCRVERAAQGLGPHITDPVFYEKLYDALIAAEVA
jgi:hypothetical protein